MLPNRFMTPKAALLSAPITTNATTAINVGSGAIFAGILVNTAGSAWTAQVYSGNPSSGGTLVATIPITEVGPVDSPQLQCTGGLYIVTSGTTPGSVTVAFH
jgi:hypothetical protein